MPLLLSLCLLPSPQDGSLRVLYYDRPPYYGEVKGRPEGVLVDLARLVLEDAGIPYHYVKVPARRVLEELKLPGNACALGWFRTPEREARYAYSGEPLFQDGPFDLVLRKAQADRVPMHPTREEVLGSGLVLGVIDGYVYGPWLDEGIRTLRPRLARVNIGTDSATMCRMAAAGRFDGFFLAREESRHVLATSPPSIRQALVVRPFGKAPPGNLRYFIFNRGVDPDLLRRLDASLRKVRRGQAFQSRLDAAKSP